MLILYLQLIILTFTASASDLYHCNARDRVNLVRVSVPIPQGDHHLASAWGRKIAETPEMKSFEKIRLVTTEFQTPPVYKGSFAGKSPEITHILDDLERMLPPFKLYREKIKKTGSLEFGKFDYIKYHEAEITLLESGINAIRDEVGRVSSHQVDLVDRLKNSYLNRMKEALSRTKAGTGLNLEDLTRINAFSAGLLGELRSACNLTGVLRVTEKAGEIKYFKEKIAERMRSFTQEVKKNPEAWKKYESQFPTMFHHTRFEQALFISEDEALKKLYGWMSHRELDVFRTRQKNSYAIVEAKHNFEPMDSDTFLSRPPGGKSYRDKLLEYQDWLKFLGVDHQVEVEFFPTGGVTNELFKELQEMKIWVIR